MSKTTLQLGQNQKSELKELKTKVVHPHEYTLKQFPNHTLTPNVRATKRKKIDQKIKSKSKVRYE